MSGWESPKNPKGLCEDPSDYVMGTVVMLAQTIERERMENRKEKEELQKEKEYWEGKYED